MSRKRAFYVQRLNRADELLHERRKEYETSGLYDPEDAAAVDAVDELGVESLARNLRLINAIAEGLRIRRARIGQNGNIEQNNDNV